MSQIAQQTVEYKDGDTLLEGYVSYLDDGKKKPLVLVAHDWSGRRQFATDTADYLANLGYIGFALDMYGKGVFGEDGNVELNSSLMNPLANDRTLLRRRVLAGFDAAKRLPQANPSEVAAMGFCFGGMCVLELARAGADVKGVVSLHGLLSAGAAANEKITAKILCLHGFDDPMVPPEQVLAFEQEMTEADVDWQLHSYGNTLHAFTNPGANNPGAGTQYCERAKTRAYTSLNLFLEEVFDSGSV